MFLIEMEKLDLYVERAFFSWRVCVFVIREKEKETMRKEGGGKIHCEGNFIALQTCT